MNETKLKELQQKEYQKAKIRQQNHFKKEREMWLGDSEGRFRVMEHLNFEQAKLRLINKLKDSSHLINNINIVRWHSNLESLKHFTAKAICSKVLMDNKIFISSECVKDSDIWVINYDWYIEIQDKKDSKTIQDKIDKYQDVFIFYLNEIPNNIDEMYKYFKKKLLGE